MQNGETQQSLTHTLYTDEPDGRTTNEQTVGWDDKNALGPDLQNILRQT